MKHFVSLIEAIVACFSVSIKGYTNAHVGPETEGRSRKEGKAGEVASTVKVTPGVNSKFENVYLRFAFDSKTHDSEKDRYHHTTVDMGGIFSGPRKMEISGTMQGDDGKFVSGPLSFDYLCPQVSDIELPSYLKDRKFYGTLAKELKSATDFAKKQGWIAKRPYTPPSGNPTVKVVESRTAWNLTGVDEGGPFKWAGKWDKVDLLNHIQDLEVSISLLALKWSEGTGLMTPKGIQVCKDSQVFRILDAGLVETGRVPVEHAVASWDEPDPSYLPMDEFQALLLQGKVQVITEENGIPKVAQMLPA